MIIKEATSSFKWGLKSEPKPWFSKQWHLATDRKFHQIIQSFEALVMMLATRVFKSCGVSCAYWFFFCNLEIWLSILLCNSNLLSSTQHHTWTITMTNNFGIQASLSLNSTYSLMIPSTDHLASPSKTLLSGEKYRKSPPGETITP